MAFLLNQKYLNGKILYICVMDAMESEKKFWGIKI